MLPLLYRVVTGAAGPIATGVLAWRRRKGKEDPVRWRERLGYAGQLRPAGPLVWVHAASVGEAQSIIGLVERILAERPTLNALITTGTVGAARFLEPRLPMRAQHQFVPADLPKAVERFLDHWRPDFAIWVESELWPNLVLTTHRRSIPAVLINGRLSARSYRQWHRIPMLVRPMLSGFAFCLAQDDGQAKAFADLGGDPVDSVGDLKSAAAPLPYDPAALQELQERIGSRPICLAACTHPGEEPIIAAAHRQIAEKHPFLLTIIAPRHPVRGGAIKDDLHAQGLSVARRALGEPLNPNTGIYLADTLGELGLFYRLAGIAFIGGSLVDIGGHNPFEAARLDCAILHGPDMRKNANVAAALARFRAAEIVTDANQLARAVATLIGNPTLREQRAIAAARAAAAGNAVLGSVLERIAPWLDRLASQCEEGSPAPAIPQNRAAAPRRANARS